MSSNSFKQFKIGAKINRESKTPKSADKFANIPKTQNTIKTEGVVDTSAGIQEEGIIGTESPSGICGDSSEDGEGKGYLCD